MNLLRVFKLKVPHKFGIENVSSAIPEASYPVLLGIAASTLGLFFLLKFIRSKRPSLMRLAVAGFLLFSFFLGFAVPNFAGYEDKLDTFHHGEQLAPAQAFSHGKDPYTDLFVLHGAGEDIVTPWLSFKLFGESIGSYYLLTGLLMTLGVAVFIFMLHRLFKPDLAFFVVALWFILSSFSAIYYIRDIPVWITE